MADVALDLVASLNNFTMNLYSEVDQLQPGANFVISPFSIFVALVMTMVGSRGSTLQGMKLGLQLSGSDITNQLQLIGSELMRLTNSSGTVDLSVANKLFLDQQFHVLEEFSNLMKNNFSAQVQQVDFVHKPEAALTEINQWVAKMTHGQIRDLLPSGSINALTKLVLANAIHFKGVWQQQFKEEYTKRSNFYLLNGRSQKVMMMNAEGQFQIATNLDERWKILKLYFSGKMLSMLIILPDEWNGLADIEDVFLTPDWMDGIEFVNATVTVQLPKFKLQWGSSLIRVLSSLGMQDMFDATVANFTGMTDKNVFISDVHHKAAVEIEEKGATASAATSVEVTERSASRLVEFKADHPFIFAIMMEEQNVPLFIGRFVEPQ